MSQPKALPVVKDSTPGQQGPIQSTLTEYHLLFLGYFLLLHHRVPGFQGYHWSPQCRWLAAAPQHPKWQAAPAVTDKHLSALAQLTSVGPGPPFILPFPPLCFWQGGLGGSGSAHQWGG